MQQITGGGNNEIKYSSFEHDKLINEDIVRETEDAKRIEVFANTEKILLSDIPFAPLFYSHDNRFQ